MDNSVIAKGFNSEVAEVAGEGKDHLKDPSEFQGEIEIRL